MKRLSLGLLAGVAILGGVGSLSPVAEADAASRGVRCTWITQQRCNLNGQPHRCTWKRVPINCTGLPDMTRK